MLGHKPVCGKIGDKRIYAKKYVFVELERNSRGEGRRRFPCSSLCRPLYGVQLQANARHIGVSAA
jgi:hypothetical protein